MDLLRSLPLGLYLEQPVTWLHRLDSRIKLGWLMSFLLAPLLANVYWRLTLVVLLFVITISARIPLRVWRQQMGWLITIALFVFILTSLAPDGLAVSYSPRLPESALDLPQPTNYRYVLLESPWFTVTSRSLNLAIRFSTILFTLIYSTNLYLLTTSPEEITTALEYLLSPLRYLKLPVTEIMLTLTLSLRFIPLVLEEIQNLVRSIRTRAIDWKKLGIKKTMQVWLIVAEKLLENLLMRAEQIAIAMDLRGFTSPDQHRVNWHRLKLKVWDWLALGILFLFWLGRIQFGGIA
ncbi:MAG: hypothetical protein D6756_05390 [Cyanobacteria bacterium J083]|nr:MAG: hypothetical protein D6756_05390 [Cyanobacteria bacterium J083]